MKNKIENSITTVDDLFRAEYVVRKRIQEHEKELAIRAKQLPEQLLNVGVETITDKIATNGLAAFSMGLVKKAGNYFFSANVANESNSSTWIDALIKAGIDALKSFFTKKHSSN